MKSAFLRFIGFGLALLASSRGMGTIDRAPMRIEAPHRPYLGYATVARSGPVPIPHTRLNQRQKRNRIRQSNCL